MEFEYSLSDLIDKLSIDHIKKSDNIDEILSDIDQVLEDGDVKLSSALILSIMLLAQANMQVWDIKDDLQHCSKEEYLLKLKKAQELNNAVRNGLRNYLLDLNNESTPLRKRSTFFNRESDSWFNKILSNLTKR